MASAVQIEILDLRHFTANSLRPVLEMESSVWSERLHWDYRSSANLLLQYLDSRVLPGYVAVENGRVSGYVFCIYEEHKAVIGDAFAIPGTYGGVTATEVESRLLTHLIELLQNSPGISRIESQLLLHPQGAHSQAFRGAGFEIYGRIFMELDLRAVLRGEKCSPGFETVRGLIMRGWNESDFNAAGRLISAGYEGHIDSYINDQYRSYSGSLRFLHNIVRFPGCGVFDALASKVVLDCRSGELIGLLLCSKVRGDVGHVTQICVAKEWRGLGLGKLLLYTCAQELAHRGFTSLTLTVTQRNESAISLYQKAGFVTKHLFDAMVWDADGL